MKKKNDGVNPRIISLSAKLRDYFLDSFIKKDDVSIFLCGSGSISEGLFRRQLGNAVAETKSKYRYRVYYPEDMFVELILGHQRLDLLTLENLLARSVSAVVILLQSPGTFAELGAFSNHPSLKDRLLVVMEPRYKKSPSFINTGPIRHLTKQTKSKVVYHEMGPEHLISLAKTVTAAAREIGSATPPTVDLTSAIACEEFYLALIMTLDPVPRLMVIKIAELLHTDAPSLSRTVAETVLNSLVIQGYAVLVAGTLRISNKGMHMLTFGARTDIRESQMRNMLTEVRIEALNVMLRTNRPMFWGGAA